ncbi:MAG: hypothetical protein JSU61_13520 [Fidelibacterota bacterium]|nr:MAG: hypothetical protein JSU61_13520 [Candidatus Neomarinimicrobiota bacterium]
MKNHCVRTAILILISALVAGCGVKEAAPKFSPAFTEYRTIQFISSRGPDPKSAMYLDNNGDILLACREGATLEQLQAAGIPTTASQLRLLETMRLLERNDGYRTAFPILDGEQTATLRRMMDQPAKDMATSIRRAMGELLELIKARFGDHNSSFSIVFAYVLDGMVWEVLEEEGLTEPRRITEEEPFWGGEVWSLYPPREFSSGTNTFWDEGVVFAVNWSRGIMPKLRQFWADRTMLQDLFNDYHAHGQVVNPAVFEHFRPFDIIDEEGYFTIPVIEERKGNDLYDRCRAIAKEVALEVPEVLDLPGIMKTYGFDDLSQTTIIAYHELMWSITEQLEADGLVSRPVAFTDPENAGMTDLADLILILQ